MDLMEIAKKIKGLQEKIVLVYAFNSTGKTRLSVAFKNMTKDQESEQHTGVYYNAFSEDLFAWNNEEEDFPLVITPSALNEFHDVLTEKAIYEKLAPYRPRYDFSFNMHEDAQKGIHSISFFVNDGTSGEDPNEVDKIPIKISRGEERIFVWCLFLAMFEIINDSKEQQNTHFFIDDPVSSLDEHNIFITSTTIYDLIENQHENSKIIITTHHIGLFAILADWLTKGEKSNKYKNITKLFILNQKDDAFSLEAPKGDVFLYHLHLLQTLDKANNEDKLFTYHFALLRQVLESIASFLGTGRFGYVLEQIGIKDENNAARIINALSHQKVYRYQTETMNPNNKELFKDVFNKLKEKYQFVLHTNKD